MSTARCPDCGWSMECDDEEDAGLMLELHRVVKVNQALGEDGAR